MSQATATPPAKSGYGREISVHKINFLARFTTYIVPCLPFAAAIFHLGYVGQGDWKGDFFIGLTALVCDIAFVAGLVYIISSMRRSLTLYENGLRVFDGKKVVFEALWSEVLCIFEERDYSIDSHFYAVRVYKQDRSKYRVFEFRNFEPLRDAIVANVTRLKSAEIFSQLQRGGAVDFSGLVMRREGVVAEGKIFPWKTLQARYKDLGLTMVVAGSGERLWYCPLARIPNLAVLFQLLRKAGIEPQ